MPIEAKDAVTKAFEYLQKVSTNTERFSNFRVEELQLDEKNNHLVTLSYEFTGEFPFEKKREFKDFVVDQDGKILSMKIRNI